eukprot:12416094-Karenia_brevis.AAC.1
MAPLLVRTLRKLCQRKHFPTYFALKCVLVLFTLAASAASSWTENTLIHCFSMVWILGLLQNWIAEMTPCLWPLTRAAEERHVINFE